LSNARDRSGSGAGDHARYDAGQRVRWSQPSVARDRLQKLRVCGKQTMMTSLHLLLWIASGIVLQVAIYLGVGFWRHWQEYQALRGRAVEFNLPVKAPAPTAGSDLATGSCSGFRTFRTERRVAGDAARSVCSGYLMPEDGQARPPFSVPDLPPLICRRLGVPNRSSVAIRCWMRLARKAIASRSNGYRRQRPANFQHGVRPVFFHDHAAVGSLLQVRAPAGHFHIDRSDAPVVL